MNQLELDFEIVKEKIKMDNEIMLDKIEHIRSDFEQFRALMLGAVKAIITEVEAFRDEKIRCGNARQNIKSDTA